MQPVAQTLAEFSANLTYDGIPPEVIATARNRFLDTLGICLACHKEPFARAVSGPLLDMGGRAESTAVGLGVRLPAASAALFNGTVAHGPDFDDTHTESIVHTSAVVVSTALAVGEAVGATGREVLTAAVVGWETITRIGAAAPGKFHRRGLHATGVCGALAAALIAGKLLKLDAPRLTAALGISGSQASGLFEYLADGSWVKRLHPGWAAHGGIMAAYFAKGGFTGPNTVLDGRFGFYNTLLGPGEADFSRLVRGLGREWETLRICYKPYPCCHYNHAFMDSIRALMDAGLRAEAVERVVCRISDQQIPIVCEPVAAKLAPRTDYEAKFSLMFCVAAMLSDGRVGIDTFAEDKIRDPRYLELASRVSYEVDPDSVFPHTFPGWVMVTTRDGRVLEHRTRVNKGSPENPMSSAEIREKFMANARIGGAGDRVAPICEQVDRLAEAPNLTSLMSLCGGEKQ